MTSPLEPRDRPPKRRGAVLRIYDAPPHRDWLLWWTVGWTIIAGIAIASPQDEPRQMPVWLDASLAALFFGATFGLLPAYLRLLWRRHRLRRARGSARGHSGRSTEAAQVDQVADLPGEAREAARSRGPGRPHDKPSSPSAGATVPITALDFSDVRESTQLQEARDSLPYPIARAARATQLATDAKDLYEATLRAGETVSIVTGVTAAAWARHHNVDTRELRELQEVFLSRGASQGHWHRVVHSVAPIMGKHQQPLPGMVEGLRRGKGGAGLLADLETLLHERNLWAHGGGPHNKVEAGERASTLVPTLQRAIQTAAFLSQTPWILVRDARLRRREGGFEVHGGRAMGDHPDFENVSFVADEPWAEDVFYLHAPWGPLDLTPLVVMRNCPTCHQQEVAFADALDERKGVRYKTFDRGHLLFDPAMADELRNLSDTEPGSARGETG